MPLTTNAIERFGIERKAKYRGLLALEEAGLRVRQQIIQGLVPWWSSSSTFLVSTTVIDSEPPQE